MTTATRTETVKPFRTPRGRSVEMIIREGTSDWNTLNACMTEDEYGLRDWHGEGWAFDIGGYLGGVAIGLALDNPGLRVICVEPVPDNARLIRENIARNDCGDRVTLLENAVGGVLREPVSVWFNYSGTESLDHHAFVGNNSIAYDGMDVTHDEVTYEAPESLGTLMDLAGVMNVALVKIDCEGGEWDFLAKPTRGTVGMVRFVDRIVGEAHAVRRHRGADIVELLAATHDVTISGDGEGTCGFTAVRRG